MDRDRAELGDWRDRGTHGQRPRARMLSDRGRVRQRGRAPTAPGLALRRGTGGSEPHVGQRRNRSHADGGHRRDCTRRDRRQVRQRRRAQSTPGVQLQRRAAQGERAALMTREDLVWGVGVALAAALLVAMLPLLPAIWLLEKKRFAALRCFTEAYTRRSPHPFLGYGDLALMVGLSRCRGLSMSMRHHQSRSRRPDAPRIVSRKLV